MESILLESAGSHIQALQDAPESGEGDVAGQPCDFLSEKGCTFPNDLRPFGCTAFICKYMYASLDRPTLKKIKRLARELEEKHVYLIRNLIPIKK